MFLDPEPRTSRRPQSQTEFQGFIPPLSPVASPADQRIIRKPLLDRSPNRPLQQKPSKSEDEEPLKPTVRLVRQSPSVASIRKDLFGDVDKRPSQREKLKLLDLDSDWKLDSPDTGTGLGVTNAKQLPDEGDTDVSTISVLHTPADTPQQAQEVWQPRNISDSNFSNATTLHGGESATNVSFAYTQSDRLSSGTTLRDLLSLHDTTLESLDESVEEAGPLEEEFSHLSGSIIHATPSRSTIRTVSELGASSNDEQCSADTPRPTSPANRLSWSTPDHSELVYSSSPPDHESEAVEPSSSPIVEQVGIDESELYESSTPEQREALDRPTSPQKRLDWSSSPEQAGSTIESSSPTRRSSFIPAIPPRISSKHASSASFSLQRASVGMTATPETVHQFSPVQSEASGAVRWTAQDSSPNFVAWNSSPTRPRSRSHPLRGEASYESISSRLHADQSPTHAPQTLASSASWSSVDPASSLDTLPSIHVPRRRLRHRGSLSLDGTRRARNDAESSLNAERGMLAYARPGFSGNLSTIASESEGNRSRTVSQQPNQTSFGSILTSPEGGDDLAFPGSWSSRKMEKSAVYHPSRRDQSQLRVSSEEEPGDMTLGLFREQSAKPEPLFQKEMSHSRLQEKKFNGPLPPLPPMPALLESGKHLDVLAELTSPKLRQQRSGYSLRHQRSNSTPVHSRQVSIASYNDSDRWSTGSNIFPTWVKHFYAGDIALASMSQISLFQVPSPPTREGAQNGMRFERFPSQPLPSSIHSHPQTSVSEAASRSPGSYRMLPAIFRPKTRQLRIKNNTVRPAVDPSRPSDVSGQTARPESLTIEPAPTATDVEQGSVLSSGHPKYGLIKGEDESTRVPLPRKYSKQKRWDSMNFPRPMSKDQLSEVSRPIPHLAPTKRSSAQIDAWRPPSFAESIDEIFKSRGHRQILFFLLGFFCPLIWMVGAVMPLPPRPDLFDTEKGAAYNGQSSSEVLQQRETAETAVQWREHKAWRQGRWWRNVNRVMSVVGLFIIAAVVSASLATVPE